MSKENKDGRGSSKSDKERYVGQERAWDKQAGKDTHKELADRSKSKNEE